MPDVSVKMGVSGVSQFIQSMQQAGASVKTIDAALKQNEKQLKATGDAETYMQQKTALLQGKLKEQEKACKQAETALKSLEANGTSKTSKSYQDMQLKLLNAQSAMMDTEQQIRELGTASVSASQQTDQLTNSLGGLNKKVSLEQVISAIGTITSGMEKAAQKAVELGKQIWENITDSARWADDTATQAMILNMDVETYQRYKGVFDTIGELTVQEWQKAKLKVQKAINDPTKDQTDVLALLGINTHEMLTGKYGVVEGAARDFEDVFWEIGEKLRAKVASGEMTQDLADTYANAIFGRGFAELNPMFALGKEGFAAALEEQTVASEEAIKKDAELNDKLIQLQNSFTALRAEVTSGLAPALTAAADTINQLLQRVMEYLQTPEGQKALEDMGKAVEGLFSDLSKIDPEQVVEGFSSVFTGIVEGLQWLEKNSGTVIGAMEAIVVGWGALKLTGGILEIAKLIQGITGLAGAGAATAAGQAGVTAGAAWGSSFASAVMAAAPWLVGLYTLLNPADTAGNDLDVLFDENTGRLTTAGWDDFYNNPENWQDTINEVGEIFGDLGRILSDTNAINAMARFKMYGDMDTLIAELEALGYTKRPTEEEIRGQNILPETAYVDEGGHMYDANGNVIGYQMPKSEGPVYHKDRRTGGTIPIIDPIEAIEEELGGEGVEVPAEMTVPEDAAEVIAEEIGTVTVPVQLEVIDLSDEEVAELFGGQGHANGLWSVPFDGYRAILHKGERVVPAREVGSSRNFSSNLYVESMYMNNGQDADGLAAAMAAAQRRTMSGYGS